MTDNRRELKFRAWDGERQMMTSDPKWVEFKFRDGVLTAWNYNRAGMVQSLPIVQFTGLKDSKGADVYEGDIVFFNVRPTPTKNDELSHQIGAVKIEPLGVAFGGWKAEYCEDARVA